MDKNALEQSKEKLEKEKENIEKNLSSFAKKDENLKGDWDTRFPHWDGDSGGAILERGADQVEEYGNLLSVEHNLESQLRDVNSALERIKKGSYGKCENCKKEIDAERLKAHPSARFCLQCERKK